MKLFIVKFRKGCGHYQVRVWANDITGAAAAVRESFGGEPIQCDEVMT